MGHPRSRCQNCAEKMPVREKSQELEKAGRLWWRSDPWEKERTGRIRLAGSQTAMPF